MHYLAIQACIIQRVVVRTENVLHFEREPTAVARDVCEEVQVIARSAERSQVRTDFLVAGISGTLHHLWKRYGRLDLVHLFVRHAYDFFQADQSGLCHEDTVVLAHAAAVVLRHVIVAQFGRQEEMEPGGLVDALSADEYQYLVVYPVAEKSGYHGHQPLLQALAEQTPVF